MITYPFNSTIGRNRSYVAHFSRKFLLFYIFGLGIALSGCTTSQIAKLSVAPNLFELAAENRRPMRILVEQECEKDCVIGRQFFLLLPLGKTRAPNLDENIFDAFFEAAVLAGNTPILKAHPSTLLRETERDKLATLRITVLDLSLHTYDLLFTRIVRGSTTLRISLNSLPPLELHHSRKQHYTTPFSKELSYELRKLLVEALREGLKLAQP